VVNPNVALPNISEVDLADLLMRADQIGLRLELTDEGFVTGYDPGSPAAVSTLVDETSLTEWMECANELGLRLEMTPYGFPIEAAPGVQHQKSLAQIFTSGNPARQGSTCDSIRVMDILIRLPDGFIKRPDLAIFCHEPSEKEGLVHQVPAAVVEITSPGYERKDLEFGPPIYLRNGVLDVLVLDRRSGEVHHWTPTSHTRGISPKEFSLACGCQITV